MAFLVNPFSPAPNAAPNYSAPAPVDRTEQYYDNRSILGQALDDVRDTFGGCSQHCQAQKADYSRIHAQAAERASIDAQMQADSDRTHAEQTALLKKMIFPGSN